MFSPHPVETNVFFFRAPGKRDPAPTRTWRDISSFEVLKKMVTADASKNGISAAFYDTCTRKLLQPADIKKIDIGGGLIHGQARRTSAAMARASGSSATPLPLSRIRRRRSGPARPSASRTC